MDKEEGPKISIISINYNNLDGLERTVESVLGQTWGEFEYIIIDGGSTDGSKEFLEEKGEKFSYWISEPDRGIYNAMNKGIRVATGEFLFFLNSGDTFYKNDVLQNVIPQLIPDIDIYYGDVKRIYENGVSYLKQYPKTLSFSFFFDSALAHQAVFIKKELFKEVFLYNEEYKILADWEFLIYAICKLNKPYLHLDFTISNYEMNGISSKVESKSIMEAERELCYIKYFPLFYSDYVELYNQRKILNSPSIKKTRMLNNSRIVRRANFYFLSLAELIFNLSSKINRRIK